MLVLHLSAHAMLPYVCWLALLLRPAVCPLLRHHDPAKPDMLELALAAAVVAHYASALCRQPPAAATERAAADRPAIAGCSNHTGL